MVTVSQADIVDELGSHASVCELGPRVCVDCRSFRDGHTLSALTVARIEFESISRWVAQHKHVCVYCGDTATQRDHLVPKPWTGPIIRRYVPTVPACADCNVRISDACVFTVPGRAAIVAASLRRKHRKALEIPDRGESWFAEHSDRMAANLRRMQMERQIIRRRLLVLDACGAPNVIQELLSVA